VDVITIEDTSDCNTCEARHRTVWALMLSVKIVCLGDAWCYDCGRRYEIVAEEL